MDYLSGGELFFHLRKRGIIQEFECRFYMAEMVLAIEYLHLIGIIHRDLKPENVLLAADGHLMLTDFGLAKETGSQETSRTLCGTNEYMAPEMLTRNGYGKSVDWWAAGILMYEMIAGRPPFQGETQLELDRKILSEKVKLPPHVSPMAHSLLKGLLEKDVNKRLGATKGNMFSIGGVAALKQHEFFSDLDWIALYHKEIQPVIDVTQGGSEDTQNFDEEFTSQGVSQSMIEVYTLHLFSF
jgi:p70 ribosomal S6 kinase